MENNTSTFKNAGEKIDNFLQAPDTESMFIVALIFVFLALSFTIYNYMELKIKPALVASLSGAISLLLSIIRYSNYPENSYIGSFLLFSSGLFWVVFGLFQVRKGKFSNEQKIKQVPLAFKHYESNFKYAIESDEYIKNDYKEEYKDLKYENGAKINHDNFQKYLLLRYSIKSTRVNEVLAEAYKNTYDSFSKVYLDPLFKLREQSTMLLPRKVALELRAISNNKYDEQINVSNLSFEEYAEDFLSKSDNVNNKSERIFIIDSDKELTKTFIQGLTCYQKVLDNHTKNNEYMYCISSKSANRIKNTHNNNNGAVTSLDFSINKLQGIHDNNLIIANNGGPQSISTKLMPYDIKGLNISIIYNKKDQEDYVKLFKQLKDEAICLNKEVLEKKK